MGRSELPNCSAKEKLNWEAGLPSLPTLPLEEGLLIRHSFYRIITDLASNSHTCLGKV